MLERRCKHLQYRHRNFQRILLVRVHKTPISTHLQREDLRAQVIGHVCIMRPLLRVHRLLNHTSSEVRLTKERGKTHIKQVCGHHKQVLNQDLCKGIVPMLECIWGKSRKLREHGNLRNKRLRGIRTSLS
jgi:hypothetical protein